jgi:hypothetical protein
MAVVSENENFSGTLLVLFGNRNILPTRLNLKHHLSIS